MIVRLVAESGLETLGERNVTGFRVSACRIRSSSELVGWVYMGGRSKTCSADETLIVLVDELGALMESMEVAAQRT